ncbi:MAG: thioredoxin [Benniella sp.]|nr:MAG: thioredoxin [Benniella sp.]
MVKQVTALQEYNELIASGKKIAVDFWATWCGPCRFVSPVFEKLSKEHPDIEFIKIDVDEAPEISQQVGIKAMPTFVTYHGGDKIGELVGANPQGLADLIGRLASA